MRPVGVLGGMGPEATILLMQKVLDAVPAQDDADHVPLIVHQNTQVPSRVAALIEGTGEDPAPALRAMAADLQRAGALALAMPCNTAHHYAQAVAEATDLPFLDMIAGAADALRGAGAARIGMLASPATRLAGVFERPFAARGLEPVWLQDDAPLLDIIRAVKAGAPQGQTAPALAAQAALLAGQGAQRLLVACTELSLLSEGLPGDLPRTDSLDCLAAAIVDFARS